MALMALASALAQAQFPSSNVDLYAQVTLAQFSANSGNDCWGYVSPSGREYALMGLNNKIAFVEITNPSSPQYFGLVAHTSSTWADVKVYQNFAYVVTEAAGAGIQVINLSQIDQHIVTLVRTIPSPARSHTLAVDPLAGFLYTCGSRNGTGTTMCFSLATPSNPVQVGRASMTTDYQHAGQPMTFTSGPYVGRTIWFGSSESRGVDIYDFTDKNNPVFLARGTYPNIGYCHQAWLSADNKYLYIDDEFDESNLGVNTRSIIMNVEDILNPTFVGTFSSGVAAIDHNQFVRSGFVFQANYRSGLRVFDMWPDPEHPVQTGWLDTYPENDNRGYDGAWSNYPFFPSGTVLISDINRGLFIVNVDAAATRAILPQQLSHVASIKATGGVAELATSDDLHLKLDSASFPGRGRTGPHVILGGYAATPDPRTVKVDVEASANVAGLVQKVYAYEWAARTYVQVDARDLTLTDSAFTLTLPGAGRRFVQAGTNKMLLAFRWEGYSGRATVWLDVAGWKTIL